jgi:hypothetical protein
MLTVGSSESLALLELVISRYPSDIIKHNFLATQIIAFTSKKL